MDQPKQRKTRLKGTPTHRPCTDCGQTKHRINDFRPRWAGCVDHRTERGRRYHQPGCDACEKIVNGNIRQPRCTSCDKQRMKRTNANQPTPTAVAVPVTVPPAEPVVAPEPVTVATPEATQEPVPVAAVVTVPPAPEPAVAPAPSPVVTGAKSGPKVASKADLAKMFAMLDGADSEGGL